MKILNYSNEILAAILGILGDNEVELSVCCWSKLLLTFSLQFAIEGDGTCTRVASIDCPVFAPRGILSGYLRRTAEINVGCQRLKNADPYRITYSGGLSMVPIPIADLVWHPVDTINGEGSEPYLG